MLKVSMGSISKRWDLGIKYYMNKLTNLHRKKFKFYFENVRDRSIGRYLPILVKISSKLSETSMY